MIDLDTSRCFFHYTTREAAFGDIIPRRRLRFSTYARMRDPMENKQWAFPAAYWVRNDEPTEVRERAYFEFQHRRDLQPGPPVGAHRRHGVPLAR